MTKKYKWIGIDIKTHEILKLESAKRNISMKKIVHDTVIEYLERHKEEWTGLTPEILEKIKVCAVKVFEPKNVKTKWIKNLVDIVTKKTNITRDSVEKGINKLIDYGILIKDYKDEISYYSELGDDFVNEIK